MLLVVLILVYQLLYMHQTCRGEWIKWNLQSNHRLKLNTDGSCVAGQCAGGGIIRDSHGKLVCAFSHFYGKGTNMKAELLAIRDVVSLCRSKGLDIVKV